MLHLNVKIEAAQLVEDMIYGDRDETMDFILKVDLGIADAEFTETLITKLWDSLRGDLNESEIATVLGNLKKTPEQRINGEE